MKNIIKMQKMLKSKEYNPGFWGLEYEVEGEHLEEAGDIKEGDLMAVRYTLDNLLYRVRVVKIYLELDTDLTEVM